MTMWNICNDANTKAAKYYRKVLKEKNPIENDLKNQKAAIRSSEQTKAITYREDINPELSVCDI